eukprot:TRINITY_DN24030_c0_g1_i1.p1 TRINITY_DN24030_c0_g1~~TRINITY_DN24030_c0_g1_i1.p1  ORF type:complete len:268 (+),score=90.64 TRINITY_DN24030_c0_g1_i1:96-806(+)
MAPPRAEAQTAASGFRGAKRRSMLRNNIFAAECLVLLGAYSYVLLRRDAIWEDRPTATVRCALLVSFGAVYTARLVVMARWLLPRELAMEELTVVPLLWLPGILASMALPAVASGSEIDTASLVASVAVYALGSWLNSWSELQRKFWKADPANAGRCYTLGLFSLSRNINYLGDVVLYSGWAIASGVWWNVWVPAMTAAIFYFHHIPDKEKYLRQRYAADWPAYERRVKSFVPFLC